MKKEIIGWTAGIIDGEGCLGLYTNGSGKKKRALLQVGNTDIRILNVLKKCWGGIVYECTRNDRPKSKRIWTYRLYGDKLLCLLIAIQPFLVSKERIAKKIISN